MTSKHVVRNSDLSESLMKHSPISPERPRRRETRPGAESGDLRAPAPGGDVSPHAGHAAAGPGPGDAPFVLQRLLCQMFTKEEEDEEVTMTSHAGGTLTRSGPSLHGPNFRVRTRTSQTPLPRAAGWKRSCWSRHGSGSPTDLGTI